MEKNKLNRIPSENEKFNITNNNGDNFIVDLKNNEDEIIKFINDIFIYLKGELQYIYDQQFCYHHYENESKKSTTITTMTNNKSICVQLLERCERILQNFNNQQLKLDISDDKIGAITLSSSSTSKIKDIITLNSKQIPMDIKEILPIQQQNPLNSTEPFNEENIYLEMNAKDNKGVEKSQKLSSSIGTSTSEYIVFNNFENNVNSELATDTIYNNYEDHYYNSLKQKHDSNKKRQRKGRQKNKTNEKIICPYIGISVMNLKKQSRNIIKSDYLNRIEKRLFFEQKKIKKLYCCIIDTWLLCYTLENVKVQYENQQQYHLILYINLKNSIEVELCNNKNKDEGNMNGNSNSSSSNHNESTLFQIFDRETTKKYLFQAKTYNDAVEWVNIIKNITNKNEKDLINKIETKQEGNDEKEFPFVLETKINDDQLIIEDVYEEPNPPAISSPLESSELYKNHSENQIIMKPNEYDKPPDINLSNVIINNDDSDNSVNNDKTQKLYEEELNYVYDIPFPLSQLKPPNNAIITNTVTTTDNKSEQQKKSDDLIKNKTEFQNKIKDIHIKLSNQLSASSSPSPSSSGIVKPNLMVKKKSKIQKENSSLSTSSKDNHQNERDTIVTNNNINNNARPVKNWFLNRLNLSSSSSSKWNKIKYKDKRLNADKNINNVENLAENNSYATVTVSTATNSITTMTTEKIKGCRINTIINQLEANGHLSMITKNLNPGYNSQQQYQQQQQLEQSNSDHYNGYEPIVTTLNTTFQNI